MLDPIGHVLIKKEFEHTELWPDPRPTFHRGMVDLGKYYKEALAGQMVTVMEESNCGDEYLVLGNHEKIGDFLWMIDKRDTREGSFMPVIKKYGIIMPAGLSPIEEFKYVAEAKAKGKYDPTVN